MEKPLISIIIPVYKVEKYLEKCIKSVLDQTYKNLQIILVDDGSPDNCGNICDNYAKIDNRIEVIHKENGGLSDARNVGLKKARGKYIGFVDSDDYVSNEMFENMYNTLVNNNADVSICNFYTVIDNKNIIKNAPALNRQVHFLSVYFAAAENNIVINIKNGGLPRCD